MRVSTIRRQANARKVIINKATTVAWLSWMTNLAGLELYLRRGGFWVKRGRKLAVA